MSQNEISDYMALDWHLEVGADEAIADEPVNWLNRTPAQLPKTQSTNQASDQMPNISANAPKFAPPKPSEQVDAGPPLGTADAAIEATRLAKECKSVEELKKAVEEFEGCPLKRTAKNTVFSDGNPDARIMLIGEAPSADDDKGGLPFMGADGALLDKMFAAIGIDRNADDAENSIYLTNVIFWRPPGNRAPNASEVAVCLPFVERHIELVKPDIVIFCGGVAAKALVKTTQGITRLRSKWMEYKTEHMDVAIPAHALFHPSYLIKSPMQKKYAWQDLLSIQQKLNEN